jgi:hypothetical protein
MLAIAFLPIRIRFSRTRIAGLKKAAMANPIINGMNHRKIYLKVTQIIKTIAA